jgi:L-ascorbate metabolism protein UlaG (beta-lactamase superfamily)
MKLLKKILQILAILIIVLTLTVYLYMQQAVFGKLPSGERLEKIKTSPQYKDGFVNASNTPALAEGASYTKIILRSLKGNPAATPTDSLPVVKSEFPLVTGKQPVITWFGHSSYLIQVDGLNLLMDPVFSMRASFAQYIGPKAYPGTMQYSVADLPSIDAVMISHDHYDHLDYNSILELNKKTKHFYVPLGVGSHLEHWGIEASRITELDWWQGATMPSGMQLTATPARHFSGRGFTRNKTLWASYVLNTGSYKLYLGGDSGYDTHFKQIGEKLGPFDLAILENGQYDANWPYIHMMPEQTVQATIDLDAKVLFPVHWGKYTLALHPWNESAIRVRQAADDRKVQVTMPRIGEQIVVDSKYPSEKWWYF